MLEKLEKIVREAGAVAVNISQLHIEEKEGHANYVTDMDVRIQALLMERLAALLPGSVMIAEEKENDALSDAPTWIVDPIDGTTNLIHDFRMSAISVALLKNREVCLACVYNPFTDEMFTAEADRGAYLNGRRITVSAGKPEKALVAFGTSPYNVELRETTMALAAEFLRLSADIRRTGSAALDLAYLAAGRTDIFFELILKPWDVAAGSLLVKEAGGCFTTPLSSDFSRPTAILAATPGCLEFAQDVFSRFVKG